MSKTPRVSGIGPRARGAPSVPGRAAPRWATGAFAVRSAPQTRHFVAAAPTRVPQVGHSRGAVVEEVDDLFMGAGIIPSGIPWKAKRHNGGGPASVNCQGAVEPQRRGNHPHGFDHRGDVLAQVYTQLLRALLNIGAIDPGGKGFVFPLALDRFGGQVGQAL